MADGRGVCEGRSVHPDAHGGEARELPAGGARTGVRDRVRGDSGIGPAQERDRASVPADASVADG